MQKSITKRAVDALKPGEMIADDALPGFVVRCLPSGRLTYGFRFTKDGRRKWLAIGVGIPPAARLNEIARLAWSEVVDGMAVVPAQRMKTKTLARRADHAGDRASAGRARQRIHLLHRRRRLGV